MHSLYWAWTQQVILHIAPSLAEQVYQIVLHFTGEQICHSGHWATCDDDQQMESKAVNHSKLTLS